MKKQIKTFPRRIGKSKVQEEEIEKLKKENPDIKIIQIDSQTEIKDLEGKPW